VKALALVVAVLATVSAADADEVRQATEQEFARALVGCWGSEWHATFMDDTEKSGVDTICFSRAGEVKSYGGLAGTVDTGRYWLADRKLHIKADVPADYWMLGASQMTCDATVRRRDTLNLLACKGARHDSGPGAQDDLGDLSLFAVDDDGGAGKN
jgi:hypothetical protein